MDPAREGTTAGSCTGWDSQRGALASACVRFASRSRSPTGEVARRFAAFRERRNEDRSVGHSGAASSEYERRQRCSRESCWCIDVSVTRLLSLALPTRWARRRTKRGGVTTPCAPCAIGAPYRLPAPRPPRPPDPYLLAWRRLLVLRKLLSASCGLIFAVGLISTYFNTAYGILLPLMVIHSAVWCRETFFHCPRCGELFGFVRVGSLEAHSDRECVNCGIVVGTPKD
jgi:hypothetical protein